ncbi:MAG: class II aldolase/adducin family protein [Rhizobiaceae bacterium]|nr:class II aldolase/adducin family protein [Rhizobiaceae bacterium]
MPTTFIANENVVDSFGHISVRNPENPNHFFISCSRSPEIVSREDTMEFDLQGNSVDGSTLRPYGERFIHGACLRRGMMCIRWSITTPIRSSRLV